MAFTFRIGLEPGLALVTLAFALGGCSGAGGSQSEAQTGGVTSNGGESAPGGSANGGTTNANGGTLGASGGSTHGGATTGGSMNAKGGAASANGGTSNGGNANGGSMSASGGTSSANGGMASGGALARGGASSGGMASGGGSSGGAGSTGKAEVRFVGRVDKTDSAGPRFAWSGSGIVARFNGTSVSVKLSSGQFTVLVDGMQKTKLAANGSMASLATGLGAGAHTVELYRRTEANQGETQFLGFDFGGGQLAVPPDPPPHRIEIIGDSITCGYGNEGADMNCPFSPDTENHYLTYGAIAARNVNAELITIAWSGKGVIYNYGDDADSKVDPLPTYYERTLPERSTSQWDFSSWKADAVVINLGTNDFSTAVDPSQSDFETAYKMLLTKIRSKYPNAYILLTNGPLLAGDDLTMVRGYLKNIVASMNDAKIKTFDLDPVVASDGYGCDWHPSLATHRKMADQLTSVLKSTLSW